MRRFLLTKPLTVLLSLLCAATLSTVFVGAAHAEPDLRSELKPITTPQGTAQGTGHVDVSPTADDHTDDNHTDTFFIAQIQAEIHDALESTTYVLQRAVDCTIDPSSPAGWLTLTTFKTSPEGAGAEHFVRVLSSKLFPPGSQFDVIFRVVHVLKQNSGGTLVLDLPKEVLISACMTVTVK